MKFRVKESLKVRIMNVLLTGGAGYIGSHTAVALINAGHTPVIYDNLCNSSKKVSKKIHAITGLPVALVEGDVRDEFELNKVMATYAIDAVIHLAGLKAVGESVKSPINYYLNNLVGAINLIKVMQYNNIKKIVFSSSATVYGRPKKLPIDESHSLHPASPYGNNKFQIEQLLQDVVASDKEWSVLSMRYFNPSGAHESGFIGEDPRDTPNNLMPFILEVASGKLKKIKIFGNDYETNDGTGVRDYIHVMDLAEGHVSALERLNKINGYDVVNLGSGKGTSVKELIETFMLVNGITIPYEVVERRPGDVAVCYADPKKAYEMLSWRSKRTIEEICKSSWKYKAMNKYEDI
jgi:UDP-glucose 4-epimerase